MENYIKERLFSIWFLVWNLGLVNNIMVICYYRRMLFWFFFCLFVDDLVYLDILDKIFIEGIEDNERKEEGYFFYRIYSLWKRYIYKEINLVLSRGNLVVIFWVCFICFCIILFFKIRYFYYFFYVVFLGVISYRN